MPTLWIIGAPHWREASSLAPWGQREMAPEGKSTAAYPGRVIVGATANPLCHAGCESRNFSLVLRSTLCGGYLYPAPTRRCSSLALAFRCACQAIARDEEGRSWALLSVYSVPLEYQ